MRRHTARRRLVDTGHFPVLRYEEPHLPLPPPSTVKHAPPMGEGTRGGKISAGRKRSTGGRKIPRAPHISAKGVQSTHHAQQGTSRVAVTSAKRHSDWSARMQTRCGCPFWCRLILFYRGVA